VSAACFRVIAVASALASAGFGDEGGAGVGVLQCGRRSTGDREEMGVRLGSIAEIYTHIRRTLTETGTE
jgi:hypothetical protein